MYWRLDGELKVVSGTLIWYVTMVLMNAIAPIDKAGRVVIPKAVREALELSDGDQLEISVEGDEIRMRVSEPEIGLIRKGKLWVRTSYRKAT